MSFNRSIDRIVEGMKSAHYMGFHYKNTFEYLVDLFPLRLSPKVRKSTKALKETIADIENQIKVLNERLESTKQALKTTCSHPVEKLVHSGYACSGTSEKYGTAMKEHVSCLNCGYTHHFELPISQDYMEDY